TITPPPRLEELRLPAPRLAPPATLAPLCSTTPLDRAGHAYGKSFRDVVRALRRDFAHPPDVVAFPRTEDEVTAVLDWCTGANAAVIPYGGGSGVVGGVEPAVGARRAGPRSPDPPPRRRCRVASARGPRRDAPAPRLGRQAEPGPPLHRLRGHPRGHHRGLDAPPGPAHVPRLGRGHVRRLRRRRRGGARPRAGGALPGQLPPPRPGRGRDRGRGLGRGGGPARGLRVRRPRARRLDGGRPR